MRATFLQAGILLAALAGCDSGVAGPGTPAGAVPSYPAPEVRNVDVHTVSAALDLNLPAYLKAKGLAGSRTPVQLERYASSPEGAGHRQEMEKFRSDLLSGHLRWTPVKSVRPYDAQRKAVPVILGDCPDAGAVQQCEKRDVRSVDGFWCPDLPVQQIAASPNGHSHVVYVPASSDAGHAVEKASGEGSLEAYLLAKVLPAKAGPEKSNPHCSQVSVILASRNGSKPLAAASY